jgi:hypothetical protein
MIDDGKGTKIAKNSDEAFWIETKEKCEEGINAANRNLKINAQLLELCEKELKLFG